MADNDSDRNKRDAIQKQLEDQERFNRMMMLHAQMLDAEKAKNQMLLLELQGQANKEFDDQQQDFKTLTNPSGQTLLQKAYLDQNFELADYMERQGAKRGSLESAAFDLSKGTAEGRARGFQPGEDSLHKVKDYGLVLGIEMTAEDGTSSMIAHIGPTQSLMADAVSDYAKASGNSSFKKIADSLDATRKHGQFQYSKPSPGMGKALAEQIKKGEVTSIPIGCKGHIMALTVIPDTNNPPSGYVAYTNRGDGQHPSRYGTATYRVDDVSVVDEKFINRVSNGLHKGESYEAIAGEVSRITNHQPPVDYTQQKGQKRDNCSVANLRSNVHATAAAMKAIELNKQLEDLSPSERAEVRKEYKEFTNHQRESKAQKLAAEIRKNPNDRDLQNLAKHYLQQHPKASQNIRGPIEQALKQGGQRPPLTASKINTNGERAKVSMASSKVNREEKSVEPERPKMS